jgi:hypothetical protein
LTDTTTITISTELRNESEIVLHAHFLAALLGGRETAAVLAQGPIAQGPTSEWTPPAAAPAAPAQDATVVADISPSSVERKFREFIHRNGGASARKLLDTYNAPTLKDVPADRLAAFVAELGA